MSMLIAKDLDSNTWFSFPSQVEGLKIIVSQEYAEDNRIASWSGGPTKALEDVFLEALGEARKDVEVTEKIEKSGNAEWVITNTYKGLRKDICNL